MKKILCVSAVLLTMMASCSKNNSEESFKKLEIGAFPEFIIEKENVTVGIVSGNGDYVVSVSNPDVVSVELSQDKKNINVLAQKVGETQLVITDTKSKETKNIVILSITHPDRYVLSQDGTILKEWKDKNVVSLDMKNDPILKKVTHIEGAFSDCEELTSIELPLGLISFGSGLFLRCTKLTEIVFPESVADFSAASFVFQDSGVQKVTFLSQNPPKANITFATSNNQFFVFYVPKESFEVYKMTQPWNHLYQINRLKPIED